MKDYMKVYTLTLTTVGPLFIGSGKDIHKMEYILDRDQNIAKILSIPDFYLAMKKKRLADSFEENMMNSRYPLYRWIQLNHVSNAEVDQCLRYDIEFGESLSDIPLRNLIIKECVKDPYGNPYVPGSSIKGMLRTILLSDEIDRTDRVREKAHRSVEQAVSRKSFLKREASQVESDVLHTLKREKERPEDAVNDVLSGLIVSDSKPLSIADLALCRKIDVAVDGRENKIPILRECIKPGTVITCQLSIDTTICKYTVENIMKAVEKAGLIVYENFLNKFPKTAKPDKNTCWLGGGCGFVQKTLVYTIFPGEEGVQVTKKVFASTGVPDKHKHCNDRSVSPHMIKCTDFDYVRYLFGECRINIK